MRKSTRYSYVTFGICSTRAEKHFPVEQDQLTRPCCCQTGRFITLMLICALVLPCTFSIYGQTSDCVPGQVQNHAYSQWSEQCYLNDVCEEQGNPCTANDVVCLGVYVADAYGGAVNTCTPGNPIPFYLWGRFHNNTNTNRYAVRTTSELYINSALQTVINQCSFDQLDPGESDVILLGEYTFTCGDHMQMLNTWIGWDTSPAQCSDPAEDDYDCCCNDYPPSKCYKELPAVEILVPNFLPGCNGSGENLTNVCVTNMSTGEGPLTYHTDFGDGYISTAENPCHTYNTNTGIFTITMTVTDANGVSASATTTVNLGALDCCSLTFDCPPATGGVYDCLADVPAVDIHDVTVTDYCGTLSITTAQTSTGGGCPDDTMYITRTFTISDDFASGTCTQVLKVADGVAPQIACPANVTVSCASNIPPVNLGTMLTDDNCDGPVTVTLAPNVTMNYTCPNNYVLLRTFVATDACGNTATSTQTVTVRDLTAPAIHCLADVSIACANEIPLPNTSAIISSDNCGGSVTVTVAPDVTSNSTCANSFTLTRVYTATDVCNNTATCAQTISVSDLAPPIITCPANVTVSCASEVPAADINAVEVVDNCDGEVTVSVAADVITNLTCVNSYTITRVYLATDECGNTASCAQTIVVDDNIAPSITCLADLTVSCAADVPAADISAIVTADNCAGEVVVSVAADVISNLLCVNQYTITRVYTAVDVCGNSAQCTQTITVNDNVAPTITCPANISVSCSEDVPAADISAIATLDNCDGEVTVSVDADVITNQTCANRYTITRVYAAADVCGNIATCAQVITVDDNVPPSITCLADMTVDCAGQIPEASVSAVVTADNCNGAVTVTVAPDVMSDFTCLNSFTVTRVYTATDLCGNTATCAQVIIVDDNNGPAILCPTDLTVSCASAVPAPNTGSVSSTDNCGGGAVVITVSPDVITNQTCANHFTITRTYTATDVCGNTSTCNHIITVNDITPPSITCLADLTVNCASLVPAANVNAIITSDNCGGGVTVTVAADVTTNFICANRFTIVRTYTAVDACGNSATCAQTITVNDAAAPIITCPANITVSCASLVPAPNTNAIITSDNCGSGVTVTVGADVTVGQSCANNFTILRTYTAADACGNTASCTQTIMVIDNIAPTITCQANVTVSCASEVPAVNLSSVVAADNCGTVNVTVLADITANQTCVNRYTLLRTYLATDACGNTATCVQTIMVNDVTAPTITCPADLTVSCASAVPAANIEAVVTNDNCGGGVIVTVAADVTTNLNCANHYTITRVYTAADACGNLATCAQTITVNDVTGPTLTCPANVTVACAGNIPAANVNAIVAVDNCGGGVTVSVNADVTTNLVCANRFTILRTYVAADACGNTAACTQTITVNDNIAPSITCAANVTVSCASLIPAADINAVTTSDNCGGGVTVTLGADVTTNFVCANHFNLVRTYIATDICGNSATCTQIITINDNSAPSITCPANVTVTCANGIPPVNLNAIITSDNCGGGVTVSVAADVTTNLTCANQFTLLRTYLATDACGNTASCKQTISVIDNTPPTVTCAANITVSCASLIPAVDVSGVIAVDNCGGGVTVSVLADVTTNFTCANRFTILRTYVATDACGNTATCQQTITVNDTSAPSITCPANVTVSCASLVPAPNTALVTTNDNCGGSVTVTVAADVITSLGCANHFTITRVYTAVDACGNSATCAQTITVNDVTAPTLTCPANVTVTCAGNIPAADVNAVVAADNCGGPVTVSVNADITTNLICANRFTILRTYVAVDACGNAASCTQTITVNDNIAPSITCPANVTVSCAANVPAPNIALVTASDNCTGTVTITVGTDVTTNLTCANRFNVIRTYIATDLCGNTATCTQTISVIDNTPPVIVSCAADVTVNCAGNIPAGNVLAIVTNDNCGGSVGVTFADVTTNLVCANNFTVVRTYTAVDACGNTATCAQTITIHDTSAPSVTCPADVTVTCASDVPAADVSVITTSDNCGGGVTVSVAADITTNQTCPNSYTILRTYTAADVCGNTAACTQSIVVDDNVPPTIICPHDLTVLCGDVPDPDITHITVSDNCSGTVTITHVSDVTVGVSCNFDLRRTYMATDACGNTTTCTQDIMVIDTANLPGDIDILVSGPIYIQCYGQDSSWHVPVLDEHDVTVVGGCSVPEITYTQTIYASENCAADGFIARYEVVYTATDTCGNSDTETLTMILVDTIAPVIHDVPDDITVNAGQIPPVTTVYATDECLCACVTLLEETPLDTGCLNNKVIVRTFSATDQCGNTAVATQRITVIDTTGPSLLMALPENIAIHDGDMLMFACENGGIPQYILDMDVHSMAFIDPSGPVQLDFTLENNTHTNCEFFGFLEENIFNWEATDACGNLASFSFAARLTDGEDPVITGVPDTTCMDDPMLDLVEATDRCGTAGLSFWDVPIHNPCGTGSAMRRTYEAVDGCGNMVRDTAILVPDDDIRPTMQFTHPHLVGLSQGDTIEVECSHAGGLFTYFTSNDVGVIDSCAGGVTVNYTENMIASGDCVHGNVGLVELTWLATDYCGNYSTLSLMANVVDHTPPVFENFHAIMTVPCDTDIPEVELVDNCSDVTFNNEDIIVPGPCPFEYDIKRLITATDACGNVSTASQLIHIGDQHGPVIEGIVEEICDDLSMPVVTAFDLCAGAYVDVTMTQDTLDETCRDGMVIIRVWTAVDACGDTTTITQHIILGDNTAPVIQYPTWSIINDFVNSDTIPVINMSDTDMMDLLSGLDANSVFILDDCDNEIIPVFDVDTIFATNVDEDGFTEQRDYFWIATDACGNADTVSFTINILDDIPPIMDLPGDTLIVCSPLPPPDQMLPVDPHELVNVVYNEVIVNGSSPGEFIVTRTWTVTDMSGNSSVITQNIRWIPDTFLSCDIVTPDSVGCNTHNVVIRSNVTGGFGPYEYWWVVIGEECFIQAGQNTPEIEIYVGWAPVHIILYVTDAYGCTTTCETIVTCEAIGLGFGDNDPGSGNAIIQSGQLPSGTSDAQLQSFNIWPNPAKEVINLSFDAQSKETVNVTLIDAVGHKTLKDEFVSAKGNNMHQIDINQLADGLYIMQIESLNHIYTKRVVILNKD